MIKLLFVLIGLIVAGSASADARFLGRVNMKNFDRSETLNVGTCGLTDILMAVRGHDISIQDVVVQFGNGDVQLLPLRQKYKKGTHTNLCARLKCHQLSHHLN